MIDTAHDAGLTPAGEPFGPYQLTRRLGRGGMAEVWGGAYLGDDGISTPVAVKRILPHLCDELQVVEMFLSEARLAMRLSHPNLVSTYNAGLLKGQPYIAMELLDGVDLVALLRSPEGRLPFPFAVSVMQKVCDGLAYVHTLPDEDGRPLGLIHRDISHSNVMVQRDGTVKLLDFGVAKAAFLSSLARTRNGEIKGKLGYMAPEVIRGGRYDHRADLFAAGVVLYELLTHRRLFKADDESSVLFLNLTCSVAPPSTINPDVPPALDAIALRALERDPAKRYASAEALARDLGRLLDAFPWSDADTVTLLRERAPATDAPASSAPAPPAEVRAPAHISPAFKRAARRRQWMGAAAIAASLGIALLAAVWWPRAGRSPGVVELPSAEAIAPRDNRLPTQTAIAPAPIDLWARAPHARVLVSAELSVPLPPEPALEPAAASQPTPAATGGPAMAALRDAHDVHAPATRASARTRRKRAKDVDMVIGQTGLLNPYSHK